MNEFVCFCFVIVNKSEASIIDSVSVFIQKFSANSPENVAKWAESKKKEAAEHH